MSVSVSVNVSNGDQNSTSVLATLAALAEASGPMNNPQVTSKLFLQLYTVYEIKRMLRNLCLLKLIIYFKGA